MTPSKTSYQLLPALADTKITRRHCLKTLGGWMATSLSFTAWGCAIKQEKVQTLTPPPSPSLAPFPTWGVTILSWDANEIPTAVGWQPQTREITEPTKRGSLAIRKATITTSQFDRGRRTLELTVDLRGGEPNGERHPTHGDGEVFVDLRYHPPQCRAGLCPQHAFAFAAPCNLRGATVHALVYAPQGSQGSLDSPNRFQLFLKSAREHRGPQGDRQLPKEEEWHEYYGDWHNIEARWDHLTLRPDTTPRSGKKDKHFNPRRVGILGLRIEAGKFWREQFIGTILLDEVVITWPDRCQAVYDFELMENTIDVLQRTRVNTVSLIPTWYMDNKYAASIHPDNLRTRAKTYPDVELTGAIDVLHQRGLQVFLKPHIDVQDETWRAEITPKNPRAWFRSYRDFIVHYTRLAEQHGVELFAVGTELESLQGPAHREEWDAIIQEIRQHYHGKLLYAANWAGNKQTGPTGGYRNVAFWDLLDLVGIDAYFPLSEAQNPSLQELIAGWTSYHGEFYGKVERHNWVEELETWQARINKPIVFAEIGYPSTDFAARRSWETSKHAANPELQARCYEAAVRVWANKPWLQGVIWWGWSPYADAGGLCDISHTPQNKPAQALL